MRSAMSFFNIPLLRDQLRRSAPLGLIYTLLWLFLLPIWSFSEVSHHSDGLILAEGMAEVCVTSGLYMAFFFGLLFAMQSFSFLTNARATGAYHALPVRREGIFTAVYLIGLFYQFFAIALSVVLSVLIACAYGSGSYLDVAGMLLAPALETVFFYSFAALCMVMTGQLFAAPVFYVIGNVLILGLEVLVKSFAGNFLFGYDGGGMDSLLFTSPLFFLGRMVDVRPCFNDTPAGSQLIGYAVDNLGAAAFYALLGLALAVISLLLYRTRKSEMTGSIVAFPWAVPIFQYGVAFCTALAFGQGSYHLLFGQYQESGDYSLPGTIGCMVVSGLLGYYVAEALVKKSLRPDRRSLRGAGAVALVLVLLGITLTFDLAGYESRIPAVTEIKTASFSFTGRTNVDTGNPETLRLLTEAHRAIVENKDEQLDRLDEYYPDEDGRVFRVYIDYHTTSGTTIHRSYRLALLRDELNDPESLTSRINALYLCKESAMSRVFGYHDVGTPTSNAVMLNGSLTSYVSDEDGTGITTADLTAAQAQTIYDALLVDVSNVSTSGTDIFALQEYASTNSVSYSVDFLYKVSGGNLSSFYVDISDATPCALAAVEELLPALSPDAISATEAVPETETVINLDPNSYEPSSSIVWGYRHG